MPRHIINSHMQALIDAARDPDYPAEIALVISNRPKAPGLAKAGEAGIQREVINHKDFENREDFEAALHASFIDGVPDLVQKINDTGDYNDEIEGELKKFIEGFKSTGTY